MKTEYVPVSVLKQLAIDIKLDYVRIEHAIAEARATSRISYRGRWIKISKKQREYLAELIAGCR